MKLVVSTVIENETERKAFLSWVRAKATSFSEIGERVNMTYEGTNEDTINRIIKVFEGYSEHSIQLTK